MDWATIAPIIAREGILVAFKIWQLLQTDAEPTQADWDELLALSQKTHDQYIDEAKAKLGQV